MPGNGRQIMSPVKPAIVTKSKWDELKELATMAFKSGLLPESIKNAEQAIIIAAYGKELGIPPMQSLLGIYVVNRMPAIRGALMLRLIYERVHGARIHIVKSTDEECTVEMARPASQPETFTFTIQEASKAGFIKKPVWQQHTSTMLRWAAIRTGARIVFADAIAGCYMEDEISENGNAQQIPVDMPTLPATAEQEIIAAQIEAAESKPENLSNYTPSFGKYRDKKLAEIPRDDLKSYGKYLVEESKKKGESLTPPAQEFVDRAREFLKVCGA